MLFECVKELLKDYDSPESGVFQGLNRIVGSTVVDVRRSWKRRRGKRRIVLVCFVWWYADC